MKTDANWLARCGVVLMLGAALAVSSCGGSGTNVSLNSGTSTETGTPAGTQSGLTVNVTSESDIAKLPVELQELLTDEGWNQPYIPGYEGVSGLPAPSHEELMALTRAKLENPELVVPRGWEPTEPGNKGTSYVGQGSAYYNNVSPPYGGANNVPNDNGTTTILKGEFAQFNQTAVPSYGCNADGSNQGNNPLRAIEDTIVGYNTAGMPNIAISHVLEGITTSNYFNTGGGNGGNARCAIYQLFATVRNSVAENFASNPTVQFAEVSFRSDLTQYGKGPGQGIDINGNPGGNLCYLGATTIAHGVKGHFWTAFNKFNDALPNKAATRNYNILIAPANEAQGVGSASSDFTSSGNSQVEWQQFYFGSVNACYGGAWIVGLSSTTNTCQTFADIFTQSPGFFHNPIYGVVLLKWQQMAPVTNPTRPWKGTLGAPVFGPVAYKNGAATVEATRRWYAWGWYFERGFMWYVDNDQTAFPNAPDEAQLYLYSGSNTYCTGGTYTQVTPSTLYLGPNANVFGVNVTVEGYSGDGTTFQAPTLNATLGRYQIPMTLTGGQELVHINVRANAYGGNPGPNCSYNSYIFSWRDGQVTFNGTNPSATHVYTGNPPGGLPSDNKQSIYVVRCQVQGVTGVAYGDSVPFELGPPAGAGAADVLVVRNDGNAYNVNYNALKADLDAIKTARPAFVYSEYNYPAQGTGATFVTTAKNAKVIIWYRGGPDTAGVLDQSTYSAQAVTDLNNIMAAPNPRPVLHISQNLGNYASSGYYVFAANYEILAPAATPALGGTFQTVSGFPPDASFQAPVSGQGATSPTWGGGAPPTFTSPFYPSTPNAGERYSGTGSSGRVPTALTGILNNRHVTCYGPQWNIFHAGLAWGACFGASSDAFYTWGNTTTGKRNYMYSLPYAHIGIGATSPAGGTRSDMLWNMLAWLDNTVIPAGGGAPPAFTPYSGPAQIMAVTPIQYQSGGVILQGNTAMTGLNYPDTMTTATGSLDVIRSTAGPNNEIVSTVAGNDGVNGNDLPFQAPFYAYITDPNGNMGTSGTIMPSGDETVVFGGLLLQNNATWTRVDPANGGYMNFQTLFPGAPFADRLPVSGYYISTTSNFVGTRRAFYGDDIPQLTFDNANGTVTYEAIAHWDSSSAPDYGPGNPARLDWSVWPGDGVVDLNGPATRYGAIGNNADNYWREIDVDPTITPEFTGRAGGSSGIYNASDFSRTGAQAQGRIVSFNYATMRGWDGDLNRNGTRGEKEDKFPVRARIYTNYATYTSYATRTWPNNIPAPTSFVEGGCYVVDQGNRVLGIVVADDGNAGNNPHTQVTILPGPPLMWDVNLHFRVSGSLPPGWDIEFSFNGLAGPWNNIETVGSASPPAGTATAQTPFESDTDGVRSTTVRINTTPGAKTFALRVRDESPVGPWSTFFWPTQVNLNPPNLFDENFDAALSGSKWQTSTASANPPGPWIQSSTGYPMRTGPGPAGNYLPRAVNPHQGSGMLRWTTEGTNNVFAGPNWMQIKSVNITGQANRTYTFRFFTAGQSYWGSGSFLYFAVSFDNGASWQTPTFQAGYNQSCGNFGSYISPTSYGFPGLTSPYAIWESNATNAGATAPPYWGVGNPTSSPRGDWQERRGTFTTTASGTVMIGFGYNGYMYYGPGLAIDSLWIE